ncbi:alpha/beta hydrolase [Clostridia bacterium]|nr:alpha/beta hydrolase [Clostridia bacterium]
MKRLLHKTAKIAAIVLSVLLALLIVFTVYHKISLKLESGKITPNGQLVEVGGNKLHVYTEGSNSIAPTLVFLSGGGTVAPIYDFKPLYSRLSDRYTIAVIEKLGYGYSDIANSSRDINTVLSQSREALKLAGITLPYVLIPHSMSGLEALYWAKKYPDEVSAIIGLDMATPEYYQSGNLQMPPISLLSLATSIGLQKLPFVYPDLALSDSEFYQAKLLSYRNVVNRAVVNETKALTSNVDTVSNVGIPNVPLLMFCGDGIGIGDLWISYQESFAAKSNARLVKLDCGHYLHQFEPERIANEISDFLLR